jgi:hypothetical protein
VGSAEALLPCQFESKRGELNMPKKKKQSQDANTQLAAQQALKTLSTVSFDERAARGEEFLVKFQVGNVSSSGRGC